MKNCLIVASSDINAKLFSAFMNNLQFSVTVSPDTKEGLALCRFSMPQVIIVDVMMSHDTITEFLQSVRGLPSGKSPYIIVCTTDDIQHKKQSILTSGADAYFVEPVLFNELQDILKDKELV